MSEVLLDMVFSDLLLPVLNLLLKETFVLTIRAMYYAEVEFARSSLKTKRKVAERSHRLIGIALEKKVK